MQSLPGNPDKAKSHWPGVNLGPRRLLLALWIGVGIQLLGQIVDVRWHAQHGSHFRSASEQVAAHWVVWVSIGVMIASAATAVGSGHAKASRGFAWALVASALYAVASGWNFWEHAHGTLGVAPHVLIAVSRIGVLVAAVLATYDLLGRQDSQAADLFKGARWGPKT